MVEKRKERSPAATDDGSRDGAPRLDAEQQRGPEEGRHRDAGADVGEEEVPDQKGEETNLHFR